MRAPAARAADAARQRRMRITRTATKIASTAVSVTMPSPTASSSTCSISSALRGHPSHLSPWRSSNNNHTGCSTSATAYIAAVTHRSPRVSSRPLGKASMRWIRIGDEGADGVAEGVGQRRVGGLQRAAEPAQADENHQRPGAVLGSPYPRHQPARHERQPHEHLEADRRGRPPPIAREDHGDAARSGEKGEAPNDDNRTDAHETLRPHRPTLARGHEAHGRAAGCHPASGRIPGRPRRISGHKTL